MAGLERLLALPAELAVEALEFQAALELEAALAETADMGVLAATVLWMVGVVLRTLAVEAEAEAEVL